MKMKKRVFIILLAIMLLLSGCNNAKNTNQGINNSFPSNTSTTASNNLNGNSALEDNATNEQQSTEIEQTKVTYSLDAEYEKAKQKCKSNAEITSLNETYAQKWYDLIEVYYNCTLTPGEPAFDDELFVEWHIKMHEDIKIIHENWEIYAKQRLKNEEERLITKYMSGSTVPVALSRFKYEFYRMHAIEMYEMCNEAFINCPQP